MKESDYYKFSYNEEGLYPKADPLSRLIPLEKRYEMLEYFNKMVDSCKGMPGTPDEKLYLLLKKAENECVITDKQAVLNDIYTQIKDWDTSRLVILLSGIPKNKDERQTDYSLFQNNKLYDEFVRTTFQNKEQRNEFRKRLLDFNKKQQKDQNGCIGVLSYTEDKIFRNFYVYETYAKRELLLKKNPGMLPPLELIKATKFLIDNYKIDYSNWYIRMELEQSEILYRYLLNFLISGNNLNPNNLTLVMLLECFIRYTYVYSEKRHELLFNGFKSLTESIDNKYKLYSLLSEDENRFLFVTEYNDYCYKNNLEPFMDLSMLENGIPEPQKDDDSNHDEWYHEIRLKTKRDGPLAKYNALCALHQKLVQKGFIEKDTPKEVFIYRFSGFRPVYSLDEKNGINVMKWNKDKNLLALLIQKMYGDNYCSPPYTKIGGFFGLSKTNFSQLYKMLNKPTIKEYDEILKQCGFSIKV